MEEMKRDFAGKLYRKACEIAEFYEELLDGKNMTGLKISEITHEK